MLLLACLMLSGCATMGAPKKFDEVTLPIESYQTQLGRDLAIKYLPNMENIYDTIRAQYGNSVDFPDKLGLGFTKDVDEKGYFSVQVIMNYMIFNTLQTGFNKRAATTFSRYGKDLFSILASQKEILNDPALSGVSLTIGWIARNFLTSQFYGGEYECLRIYAQKNVLEDFLGYKISNQEFINKCNVYGMQGTRELGKIEVDLKQTL